MLYFWVYLLIPLWSGHKVALDIAICLFEGFKVLRDVIHDNYIQRPKGEESK